MKLVSFSILPALLMGCWVRAGESSFAFPTNAPAKTALSDQFDVLRELSFPRTNLVFLTIADKAGSEQVAAWITPVERRFGNVLAIEGIADVSAVPRPLRGLVRRRFQKAQQHSIMLDWSGEKVRAFGALSGRANVLVLDLKGRVIARLSGKATDQAIEELCVAIQKALPDTANRPGTLKSPTANESTP